MLVRRMLYAAMALLVLPAAGEFGGNTDRGAGIWQEISSTCHAAGVNAWEPELVGAIGRPVASASGSDCYSDTFRALGAAGQDRVGDELRNFMSDPMEYAPATYMEFAWLEYPGDVEAVLPFMQAAAPGDSLPDESALAGDDGAIALEGDPEFGAFLSGECSSCHRRDGSSDGIPSIVGWPEEAFVAVMVSYRNKERDNPTMQVIAGRLSDEEIAALAAYYAIP